MAALPHQPFKLKVVTHQSGKDYLGIVAARHLPPNSARLMFDSNLERSDLFHGKLTSIAIVNERSPNCDEKLTAVIGSQRYERAIESPPWDDFASTPATPIGTTTAMMLGLIPPPGGDWLVHHAVPRA